MQVIRYGEILEMGVVSSSLSEYLENPPKEDMVFFSGHFRNHITPHSMIDFFLNNGLDTTTRWLDFSGLSFHTIFTKSLFDSIPDHVNTLEFNLRHSEIDDEGEEHVRYRLPASLLDLPSHITKLVLHYPANFKKLSDFSHFLDDLKTIMPQLPFLNSVYFTCFAPWVPFEDADYVRKQILANLLVGERLESCRFYHSNSAEDYLISSHHRVIKDPALFLYIQMLNYHTQGNDDLIQHIFAYYNPIEPGFYLKFKEMQAANAEVRAFRASARILRSEYSLFRTIDESALHMNRNQSWQARKAFDEQFGLVPYSQGSL